MSSRYFYLELSGALIFLNETVTLITHPEGLYGSSFPAFIVSSSPYRFRLV